MSFERKPKRLVIFIKNAGDKRERRYRGSLSGRYHWFESRPLRQIGALFGIEHRGQASLETPWSARVGSGWG
jgi:hypothetical protein